MHLFTQNYDSAYEIFYHLVPHYKHNPRVWYRLAECRLETCKSRLSDFSLKAHQQDIVGRYTKQGMDTKIVHFKSPHRKHTDTESLAFVRSCLLNSLQSLNSSECNFRPSNPPSETEMTKFKISLFTSLAYVSLALSDFSLAYTYAKFALKLEPTSYQKVLANLYAGEALIWLDQYNEAIPHFSPEHAVVEPPIGDDPVEPLPAEVTAWFPTTAKVVLLYNLAATFSLRGEHEKAAEILRQLASNAPKDAIMPVQAFVLSVYIKLQQGATEGAKHLIRQLAPHLR
jgi:tetratricopeptide (TPR) repeat protein